MTTLRTIIGASSIAMLATGALASDEKCIEGLAIDTDEVADRYVQAVEDYSENLGFFQKMTAQTIINGVNLACKGVEGMGHGDIGFCLSAIFSADDLTGDNFQQELEVLEQRWVSIRDGKQCINASDPNPDTYEL